MIKGEEFLSLCIKHGFTFFSGVPDSTFKSFMTLLCKNPPGVTHVQAVNECEATAICTGYHLATGDIGVLYMQSAGFGKTINPLTSLCDPAVYSIPLLLMIGWRGEPGKKDAYQHHKIGQVLLPMLDLLEIPYEILPSDITSVNETIQRAKQSLQKNNKPFALVVQKGIFEDCPLPAEHCGLNELKREDALTIILKTIPNNSVIISTTGKISRELFEYRERNHQDCSHDFYNIGSMGCAHPITLGIALQKKNKKIFVFDGDGAAFMEMGTMATTGHYKPENLHHIIFDNQAHDSTGGQPTCSDTSNLEKVALACGYRSGITVRTKQELQQALHSFIDNKGPQILIVKVKKGSRDNLGRPPRTPQEYKQDFMKSLKG